MRASVGEGGTAQRLCAYRPPPANPCPQGGGEFRQRLRKMKTLHHAAPPIRNSRASMPSGPWVAAMIRPPRARWSRIRPANRSWPAVSSAEVGSSSSQTGRRTASSRASDSRRRWPADRKAAGRCAAWSSPTDARLWLRVEGVAAEKIAPERQILQHAQRRLQRVAMAEIVRLLGKRQLGVAAVQAIAPPAGDQQARDQPQQRGLARSVGARDRQGLAGRRPRNRARKTPRGRPARI